MKPEQDLLRTTSFRVSTELFGSVYLLRAGERFQQQWRMLEGEYRARKGQWNSHTKLPYTSLVTALRVLTGGFVRLEPADLRQQGVWMVSSNPIEMERLRGVALVWERLILDERAGFLELAFDDLEIEHVEVAGYVKIRPDRCPRMHGWVWETGLWHMVQLLAASPLQTDGEIIPLRVDVNANLLTWDRPLRAGRDERDRAIHRIIPKLITIPGVSKPILHLDSSLSRLSHNGRGRVKATWVDRGKDSLLLEIPIERYCGSDREWRSRWAQEHLVSLLNRTTSFRIPEADQIDWAMTDEFRIRYQSPPSGFAIGKGVGQMFHECVALHTRQFLSDAKPVELVKAVRQLRRHDNKLLPPAERSLEEAIRASGVEGLHLLCLYSSAAVRKRIADALAGFLKLSHGPDYPPRDGVIFSVGGIRIVFLAFDDGSSSLDQSLDEMRLAQFLRPHLASLGGKGIRLGAIIETTIPYDQWDKDKDNKRLIRSLLAKEGAVSQFITANSAPDQEEGEDYAAKYAVWDLLRSSGIFPREFPSVAGRMPGGTWLMGTYAVYKNMPSHERKRKKGIGNPQASERFLVLSIAVEAGGRHALAYVQGRWQPLGEATFNFHAADRFIGKESARDLTDQAIQNFLVQNPHQRLVWFVEATGCRRFWNGITDKGGDCFPTFFSNPRIAAVRVRSNRHEVPRPAAKGDWPKQTLSKPGGMDGALLRIRDEVHDSPWFFVATPRLMNKPGVHREHTRFTVSRRSLRNDWQALSPTEFFCLKTGEFSKEQLYKLAASLCRQAPTWFGVLDWPSPLHLARAIVRDHPLIEVNEVQDKDQG